MSQTGNPENQQIRLTAATRRNIIEHCRRKLTGGYLDGEEQNLKAYGLLAGTKTPGLLTINASIPLVKNARTVEPHRSFMDKMMRQHAVASVTPLAKRGWVADPAELTRAVTEFKRRGLTLIGSYHMHRVAWDHDDSREAPTTLDTVLGRDSRLVMFIVSMVKPDRPIIRAFFEGIVDREIPIIVMADQPEPIA
jgi:hypothetical protein